MVMTLKAQIASMHKKTLWQYRRNATRCEICDQKPPTGLVFHHVRYTHRRLGVYHRQFVHYKCYEDNDAGRLQYKQDLFREVKASPERFMLLCNYCHGLIEKYKKKLVWYSNEYWQLLSHDLRVREMTFTESCWRDQDIWDRLTTARRKHRTQNTKLSKRQREQARLTNLQKRLELEKKRCIYPQPYTPPKLPRGRQPKELGSYYVVIN